MDPWCKWCKLGECWTHTELEKRESSARDIPPLDNSSEASDECDTAPRVIPPRDKGWAESDQWHTSRRVVAPRPKSKTVPDQWDTSPTVIAPRSKSLAIAPRGKKWNESYRWDTSPRVIPPRQKRWNEPDDWDAGQRVVAPRDDRWGESDKQDNSPGLLPPPEDGWVVRDAWDVQDIKQRSSSYSNSSKFVSGYADGQEASIDEGIHCLRADGISDAAQVAVQGNTFSTEPAADGKHRVGQGNTFSTEHADDGKHRVGQSILNAKQRTLPERVDTGYAHGEEPTGKGPAQPSLQKHVASGNMHGQDAPRRVGIGFTGTDPAKATSNYASAPCRLDRDEEALPLDRQCWDPSKEALVARPPDTCSAGGNTLKSATTPFKAMPRVLRGRLHVLTIERPAKPPVPGNHVTDIVEPREEATVHPQRGIRDDSLDSLDAQIETAGPEYLVERHNLAANSGLALALPETSETPVKQTNPVSPANSKLRAASSSVSRSNRPPPKMRGSVAMDRSSVALDRRGTCDIIDDSMASSLRGRLSVPPKSRSRSPRATHTSAAPCGKHDVLLVGDSALSLKKSKGNSDFKQELKAKLVGMNVEIKRFAGAGVGAILECLDQQSKLDIVVAVWFLNEAFEKDNQLKAEYPAALDNLTVKLAAVLGKTHLSIAVVGGSAKLWGVDVRFDTWAKRVRNILRRAGVDVYDGVELFGMIDEAGGRKHWHALNCQSNKECMANYFAGLVRNVLAK